MSNTGESITISYKFEITAELIDSLGYEGEMILKSEELAERLIEGFKVETEERIDQPLLLAGVLGRGEFPEIPLTTKLLAWEDLRDDCLQSYAALDAAQILADNWNEVLGGDCKPEHLVKDIDEVIAKLRTWQEHALKVLEQEYQRH